MEKLVSVIIPSFNRRHDLCKCIDSVYIQEYKTIEVVVVDDCSEDDSCHYIKSYYPDVVLIQSRERYGPSHLRNLGINRARGDLLSFIDSDVIMPDKKNLKRMVEKFANEKRLGELGGEIPFYLGIKDEARGKRRDSFGRNHDVTSKRSMNTDMKPCTYLATCNCMVRASVAKKLGGFDPYYKFGGEDADFGFRLLKAGYCNFVDFNVSVYHKRSVTGRYPDETYRYHLTRVRYNLKHFSLWGNAIILLLDSFRAILFYLVLLPKIAIKKVNKETLVTENYLGGYYLIKAYKANLEKYSEIKRSRTANFLSKEEMERFEAYVASESKGRQK
jgi:GT2 family glycosyltransferase